MEKYYLVIHDSKKIITLGEADFEGMEVLITNLEGYDCAQDTELKSPYDLTLTDLKHLVSAKEISDMVCADVLSFAKFVLAREAIKFNNVDLVSDNEQGREVIEKLKAKGYEVVVVW
jgi:hypothetical protein